MPTTCPDVGVCQQHKKQEQEKKSEIQPTVRYETATRVPGFSIRTNSEPATTAFKNHEQHMATGINYLLQLAPGHKSSNPATGVLERSGAKQVWLGRARGQATGYWLGLGVCVLRGYGVLCIKNKKSEQTREVFRDSEPNQSQTRVIDERISQDLHERTTVPVTQVFNSSANSHIHSILMATAIIYSILQQAQPEIGQIILNF